MHTLIRTRFLAATATRPLRIVVNVAGTRRTLPYDGAAYQAQQDAHVAAVAAALGVSYDVAAGWPRAFGGKGGGGGYVVLAPWGTKLRA